MIGSRRRRLVQAGLVMCALACGSAAFAEEEVEQKKPAAQALFDKGKALMESGDFQRACAKFEESMRLDAGIGTQYHLANCYEKTGRYASAWSNFLEVAAEARKTGQGDRESFARQRAEALEPKLSRVRILVEEPVDGLTIARGDVDVGRAQWGTPVPADSGTYEVVARALGKEELRTEVTVGPPGSVVDVPIPPLEDAPEPPPEPDAPLPPGEEPLLSSPTKVGALAAAGVGVVALGVGTVAGIVSMGKGSDSEEFCNGNQCTQPGVDLREDAIAAGNVSTVAFIIGGVAIAAGATLWLWPEGDGVEVGKAATLRVGVQPGGIALDGAF